MSDLLNFVGGTPHIDLNRINTNPNVRLIAKLEGNNPGGSLKDRAAYNMIKCAMDRGDIKEGTQLIEATSGNTGIALAMIANLFNIEIELVMPENSTRERVLTMKAFGAKVTLTPANLSMEGAIDYATNKVETEGYFMLNQFSNPDNWGAHYKTTGPEIWDYTEGDVTHFVAAMGTTGTIMGTSRFLKEKKRDVVIVGAQPTDGSRIPGIRKWPKEYLPKIFESSRVDEIIEVSETEARIMANRLAKEEGIFCGMSSGGSVATALKVIDKLDSGTVVCIICDRGDRYLSSDLFG